MKSRTTWLPRPFTPEQEAQKVELTRALALPPLIAKILLQRNLSTEKEARRFLHGTLADLPNPFLLNDMKEAVERLLTAVDKKQKIVLFGDYDVDGISGTAQLFIFLREIGADVEAILPHREHDGYGLTTSSVAKILRASPKLLVTIDNGTKSKKEIQTLHENGIETIIIDHHETPLTDQWPPVVALVNPKRTDSTFPEKDLASAGLIFLLLMGLRSQMREAGRPTPNLKRYLDLSCLGTIADIVPMVGTNRLLVRYGLEELGKTTRPGLMALKQIAGIQSTEINVGHVSFQFAPRINAAGRLDDPRKAFDLLVAQDGLEATLLAQELENFNRQRQTIEETVLKEAVAQVEATQKESYGIVVASAGWHLGVVGIVAAKLTELFGKPAVVLSIDKKNGEARGSARTVSGISVHAALKKIEGEMQRFGGHAAAAGMTVAIDNLESFTQKFDQSVRELFPDRPSLPLLIDEKVGLHEIDFSLIQALKQLEPHGPGNPAPVLMTSSVSLKASRLVGKGHLKTTVHQDGKKVEAIGFHWGDYLSTANETSQHNIAFYADVNEWNGTQTIQLKIKALQPS